VGGFDSLFLFRGSRREVEEGWGAEVGGTTSTFVLSALTGMVGISLVPWLGEVAVSGEEGVSRITSCSGSGDPGSPMSGEAGVSVVGMEDEVVTGGGVADWVSGEGICSGEAVWVSGDMGQSAMLRLGGESVGEDQGGRWLLGGVCAGGGAGSNLLVSGCWVLWGVMVEGRGSPGIPGENSLAGLPSSLDLRLSSLFIFSASESLGFSAGRSKGMDFGADSFGLTLGSGNGGEDISGESGVSWTGDMGVSGSGDWGV